MSNECKASLHSLLITHHSDERGLMDIDRFNLEWLLRPTTLDTFFRDYWEKRPLTVFRGEDAYFREVLSLADMDHILSSHDLRHPSLQLVKNKAPVPTSQYTTEVDVKGVPV